MIVVISFIPSFSPSHTRLSLWVSLTLTSKSHHHQELIKCIQLFLFFHFLFEIKLSFRDQVFSPSFLLLYVLKKNRFLLMQDFFFLLFLLFQSFLSLLVFHSFFLPHHLILTILSHSVWEEEMWIEKRMTWEKSDLIAKAREEWEGREENKKWRKGHENARCTHGLVSLPNYVSPSLLLANCLMGRERRSALGWGFFCLL